MNSLICIDMDEQSDFINIKLHEIIADFSDLTSVDNQQKGMQSTTITIKAEVHAPIEKVWKYWTVPEHITQWNFAHPSWQCPWAENDLQPGGIYRARMEAKDGSFGFEFEAVYDEIVLHSLIAYTMTDGRKAVTSFTQASDCIQVVTRFDAEQQNSVEIQQQGWQAILNNFKHYAETN